MESIIPVVCHLRLAAFDLWGLTGSLGLGRTVGGRLEVVGWVIVAIPIVFVFATLAWSGKVVMVSIVEGGAHSGWNCISRNMIHSLDGMMLSATVRRFDEIAWMRRRRQWFLEGHGLADTWTNTGLSGDRLTHVAVVIFRCSVRSAHCSRSLDLCILLPCICEVSYNGIHGRRLV